MDKFFNHKEFCIAVNNPYFPKDIVHLMKDVYGGVDNGNIQMVFKFPNGYGASVVKFPGSMGYQKNLWEIGTLKFKDDSDEYELLQLLGSTEDTVKGYLSDKEVERHLTLTKNLPTLEEFIKMEKSMKDADIIKMVFGKLEKEMSNSNSENASDSDNSKNMISSIFNDTFGEKSANKDNNSSDTNDKDAYDNLDEKTKRFISTCAEMLADVIKDAIKEKIDNLDPDSDIAKIVQEKWNGSRVEYLKDKLAAWADNYRSNMTEDIDISYDAFQKHLKAEKFKKGAFEPVKISLLAKSMGCEDNKAVIDKITRIQAMTLAQGIHVSVPTLIYWIISSRSMEDIFMEIVYLAYVAYRDNHGTPEENSSLRRLTIEDIMKITEGKQLDSDKVDAMWINQKSTPSYRETFNVTVGNDLIADFSGNLYRDIFNV